MDYRTLHKFIMAFQNCKNPLLSKGFDMDQVEIVAPGANREAVFSGILAKMAFGHRNG